MSRRPRGGVEVQLYSFFNLGARCCWVVNATPQSIYPRERDTLPIVQDAGWAPGQFWTGVENLATTGLRSPYRPARSESLHRLSYPGPHLNMYTYVYRYVYVAYIIYILRPGVAQWLRHCATSRTASGSIPDGVTRDFFRSYRQNHMLWDRLSL